MKIKIFVGKKRLENKMVTGAIDHHSTSKKIAPRKFLKTPSWIFYLVFKKAQGSEKQGN